MRDADAIVLMLLIGYIVYTTMKGNLRKWLEVFGLKNSITPSYITSGSILGVRPQ